MGSHWFTPTTNAPGSVMTGGSHRRSGFRRLMVGAAVIAGSAAAIAGCTNGGDPGTAWGGGSFDTNGERIYFTSTSDSGDDIDYEGGPGSGGMMTGGRLSCASCHGPDARGGTHRMHMDVMDAPNIRWIALAEQGHDDHAEDTGDHDADYGVDDFRSAVMGGVHGDGEPLSDDMPRWSMSERDLHDLIEQLQSFDEL